MRCAVLVLFVVLASSISSAGTLQFSGGGFYGEAGVTQQLNIYPSGRHVLNSDIYYGTAESQPLTDINILLAGTDGQTITAFICSLPFCSFTLTDGLLDVHSDGTTGMGIFEPQDERTLGELVFNGFDPGAIEILSGSYVDGTGTLQAIEPFTIYQVGTPVPEPSTAFLMSLGLLALAARRRTRAFALVLPFALLVGAESASAQSSDPFQIVGVTSTSHQGGEGVRTFTLACQADYGPAARMCTTEEVLQTIVWPVIDAVAWVMPVIVSGDSTTNADMSGVGGNARYLSCGGWDDSTRNGFGIAVTTSGSITTRSVSLPGNTLTCDEELRVACCKRVPEPSAALSLPIGAMGLVGLAAMKGSA